MKPSAGLGAYPGSQLSLDDVMESPSCERWLKAQDRYVRLNVSDPTSSSAADGADPATLRTNVASTKAGQIKWVKGQ